MGIFPLSSNTRLKTAAVKHRIRLPNFKHKENKIFPSLSQKCKYMLHFFKFQHNHLFSYPSTVIMLRFYTGIQA